VFDVGGRHWLRAPLRSEVGRQQFGAARLMDTLAALAWGMSAAVVWGFCAPSISLAVRHGDRIWPVMFWLFVFSLLTAVVAAVVVQKNASISPAGAAAALGMGLLYTLGDYFYFAAVKVGRIAVVAPIVGCNGAISAVLAVLAGASLTAITAGGLVIMLIGLLAVTSAQGGGTERLRSTSASARPVLFAVGSGLSFGVAFFVSGKIRGVDPAWIVALSRVACIVAVLAICAGREPIAIPKQALYWAALAGSLDAAGYIAFIQGSQYSIPVAAITTSQWAGLAVFIGILMLRERLTIRQTMGVVLLVAGTAVVAVPG
jgi:uncharacterized membrane protein